MRFSKARRCQRSCAWYCLARRWSAYFARRSSAWALAWCPGWEWATCRPSCLARATWRFRRFSCPSFHFAECRGFLLALRLRRECSRYSCYWRRISYERSVFIDLALTYRLWLGDELWGRSSHPSWKTGGHWLLYFEWFFRSSRKGGSPSCNWNSGSLDS